MKRVILILAAIAGWMVWVWLAENSVASNASAATPEMQAVRAHDFEEALLKEILRRYSGPTHHISLQVLYPQHPIRVPKGRLHIEVDEVNGGRTGRRAFRVQIFVDGQFVKTVNVVGELKGKADAAMPVRWIKPKEILSVEDIEFVSVEVPTLIHDLVLTPEEVIGKQVLRPLPPHQPIRKTALDAPPVVHKGDRVMIEVKGKGLLVQTVGMAKSAGRTGETIPVMNQSSGREILGMVLGAGVVEVPF